MLQAAKSANATSCVVTICHRKGWLELMRLDSSALVADASLRSTKREICTTKR